MNIIRDQILIIHFYMIATKGYINPASFSKKDTTFCLLNGGNGLGSQSSILKLSINSMIDLDTHIQILDFIIN